MLTDKKNLIYITASIIVFAIIAFVYASPVLTGKALFQHDIVQYKGGARELLEYRDRTHNETYWSDSMFGGMPTYQMGAQFRGDLITKIDDILNIFPKPVNYLFTLFAGFFLLGMVAVRNWRYALLGANFFGLSTYFYIIIAAGHNGKVHSIAYFAPLLAGILFVYFRKKYVWGFIVTTLFMGLQIAANHPQMTYYLFIALGFLFVSELVRAIRNKISWRHFLISSGIVAAALVLGVGMNSQRLMANAEYVKETVRGEKILQDPGSARNSGMDKESTLAWSYGKLETLNLFIPRLMGGATQEKGKEYIAEGVQSLAQENIQSEQEAQRIGQNFTTVTYWGEQPGTSGPAYQGAVVIFLAVLGFFFAPKKYRYWILGATILSILLAWGSNMMWLSDLFIDYLPFYNKFRAPSSILVVPELLLPLIAIIGLYYFLNSDNKIDKHKKKVILLSIGGAFLLITLLLLFFGKSILTFATEGERTNFPPYLLDYLKDERFQLFKSDAIKAVFYLIIVIATLYLAIIRKLKANIVLLIIGLVSFFDLWNVNKDYLSDDNFVDKTFADQPFQTESSELLQEKVGENPVLQPLLANVPMHQTLATIAEKDKGHYRVFNQLLGPFNETNTSYFTPSVGGYHAVKLRRYDDLINHYFYSEKKQDQIPQILSLLNTKYVVGGSPEQPEVQLNPMANGNAWFVPQVSFKNSANEEIDAIGTIETKKTAVISAADKNYFNGKNLVADSTASIKLDSYQPNELKFSSQSKTPQLAVFSEIYYPHGWRMFLDEKEVPYIKADYLLRAVYVPAGRHSIRMEFAPTVITKGKIFSMLAFFLFVLSSAAGLYLLYRKREPRVLTKKA